MWIVDRRLNETLLLIFLQTLGLFLSLGLMAQSAPQETPAPVSDEPSLLENFSEVNPDGTYKFGYKASDGTFKSETKDKNGVVTGKLQPINTYYPSATVSSCYDCFLSFGALLIS